MTKVGLIILVLVTASIIYVKSQQRCSESEDCWKGCCVNGTCKGDGFYHECSDTCLFDDSDCIDGCCIAFKCEPKTSSHCVDKNKCTANSDCSSNCCKDNKCQETDVLCFHFSLPTINVKDILKDIVKDKCSTSNDCFSTATGCCVDGHCRACTQDSPYDYNDNYYSGRSSSGLRTANYFGLRAVILVIVLMLKIAFWAWWCNRWQSSRRNVVEYKRLACVENGQFEREHERAVQGIPDCPPPTYSPRVRCDGDTQNSGQNPDQAQGEENVNTREGNGVQQGPTMGPPPAYSPRPLAKSPKNNNSAQQDQ